MEWHWTELPSLLLHLPDALHDLVQHEDKKLVDEGIRDILAQSEATATRHRLILPDATPAPPAETGNAGDAPSIGIEKDIDPGMLRDRQNLHLLAHDYLHTLPDYEYNSAYAQKLIEHWQKILLEQPLRLSEAQLAHWRLERTREFWQDRLKHHPTATHEGPHPISEFIDDWQRGDATPPPPPFLLGLKKAKQWQDLIIRNRLHLLTLSQDKPYGWISSPDRGGNVQR